MPRTRKAEGTGQYLFNPSNFDVRRALGGEWAPHENAIRWLLHKIIRTSVRHRHEDDGDGFVNISQKTMRTFMDCNVQAEIKRLLIQRAVIEVRLDRNGNEDYLDSKIAKNGTGYSKGYRMAPEYDREVAMWEITSMTLANKMIRNRFAVHDKAVPTADMMEVYLYLERWLSKVTILPEVDWAVAQMPLPPIKRKKRRKTRRKGGKVRMTRRRRNRAARTLASYHSKIMIAVNEIRMIGSDHAHRPLAEVCPHLRLHTSITHLATACRPFLRVAGHEVVNVDIRNSQIVFFMMLYMRTKLDGQLATDASPRPLSSQEWDQGQGVEEELEGLARIPKGTFSNDDIAFFKLVLTGRLYDWLMERMGITKTSEHEWENIRKGYKRTIFKDVFYGDTSRRYTHTPLSECFAKTFPNIWAFIKQAKKDGYEKLAQLMQRQEAQFVLHTVCKRLKDHHPHVPVLTVHDSLMVPPEHADDVHRVMTEEFMRLGLRPAIRIGKD